MGLETVNYISDLVATNPPNTDPKSQGAAHLRNIKVGLLNSFPLIAGPVSATHEDLSAISSINPGTLPAVNGANITKLNASALASGTVPDARLSSNVPLKNASNDFAADANRNLALSSTGAHEKSFALRNSARPDNVELVLGGNAIWGLYDRGNNAWRFQVNASNNVAIAGANITLNGVNVTDYARLSQPNAFQNFLAIRKSGSSIIEMQKTDAPTDRGRWRFDFLDSNGTFGLVALDGDGLWLGTAFSVSQDGAGGPSTNFSEGRLRYAGIDVGYKGLPTYSSGALNGKVQRLTSGTTLNTGQAESTTWVIYNNSGSAITLTQGSGLTLRLGGTTTTGNRTLLPRGFATVYAVSTTEYVVTGHVT